MSWKETVPADTLLGAAKITQQIRNENARLRQVLRGIGAASDGEDSVFARWVARQVNRALKEDGTEPAR